MKLPQSPEETLDFLARYDALDTGHFKLASGRHSAHYVQKGKLVQFPGVVADLISARRAELDELGGIDVVFSPAIGGIPVGQQVAAELGCRHIFSERDAKNQMVLKRGFEVKPGERALLVEDVITTGSTLREIRGFVEDIGAEVAGVFAIFNRTGSGVWDGLPLIAPLAAVFATHAEDELPAELAAIPVTKPGTKQSGVDAS